jgi:hypothetical protein
MKRHVLGAADTDECEQSLPTIPRERLKLR